MVGAVSNPWLPVILRIFCAVGISAGIESDIRAVSPLDCQPAEESKSTDKALRPYSQGPMQAADFRMRPPTPLPSDLRSRTETDIHWKFEFRQTSVARAPAARSETARTRTARTRTAHTVRLELTSICVFSVVLPDECWSIEPGNKRLLDHSQGHLDITEAFARELQVALRKEIREGKALYSQGDNESQARLDLERQIQKRLEAGRYELLEQHRNFDRDTDHGRNSEELSKLRKKQRKRLQEFSEPPPEKPAETPAETPAEKPSQRQPIP